MYSELWKEDAYFVERVKMYGKTIAFGMAFVTTNLHHKKDSGENSRTRMNLTEKTVYFLGHTKRQVIPRSLSWTLNFSVMEHR